MLHLYVLLCYICMLINILILSITSPPKYYIKCSLPKYYIKYYIATEVLH